MSKTSCQTKAFLVSQAGLVLWRRQINHFLSQKESVTMGSLKPMIKAFYSQRGKALLRLAKKHPTPFYVFDESQLSRSARDFKRTFNKHLPGCQYYYAVKANWHPLILKSLVKLGFGLDVSSARELELGLKAKAKKMVFSGPGKTAGELQLALKHQDKVIVHLDSFGELVRLGQLTNKRRQEIRAGVRIFTRFHGPWNKFGIALEDLSKFWLKAEKYPYLKLAGIQFHLSWNKDAKPYQNVIKALATYLKSNFNQRQLLQIKFIDFGGGFLPHRSSGYYPWSTAQGDLIKKAAEYSQNQPHFFKSYYLTEASTLEDYARGIAGVVKNYLKPLLKFVCFTEPGRVICHKAMHLVMRVADVKEHNKIIMDGGVNIVGWEGLRYDYTPLVNLTHFSQQEVPCLIYGCLCMADDIWGYSCYAKKIITGDVMAIPYFGAYTFTLAQEFIKPIPPVYPAP